MTPGVKPSTLARVCFRHGDRRLFSRIVVALRGGDSAHCEVAYDWSGSTHKCVSSSFLDGGLRAKEIEMSADKWRIYEVLVDNHPLDYLEAHKGARYDFLGLLGILLPRISDSKSRKFCSEVGAEILGLSQPQLYDLRSFETVCAYLGKRVL